MTTNEQVNKHTGKDDWGTPQWLFDILNEEFNFNLDVCSDEYNYKVRTYFSKLLNGLRAEWYERNFCNPPYGKEIKKWVNKAIVECSQLPIVFGPPQDDVEKKCVMLLPSRTDTKWFHLLLSQKNVELLFIPGRLKFEINREELKQPAQFPNMLAFFNCKKESIEKIKEKIYQHQTKRAKRVKKDKIRSVSIF